LADWLRQRVIPQFDSVQPATAVPLLSTAVPGCSEGGHCSAVADERLLA
jgi:hypothetical protein